MVDYIEHTEAELSDNPADQLQDDIADRLAVLSDAVDMPLGFERSGGSFDASMVDFETGSWMSRLADVQGWLNLDAQLPNESAEDFVLQLVALLGFTSADDVVDLTGSLPRLGVSALSRLYERVDQAVRLQRVFTEAYEGDGSTKAAASRVWSEAWEGEPETQDAEPPEPVSATASTWRISDFTGKKLNLTPSYQRGDVWGTPARQLLIESILRGIPLPSVILLKPEDPSQPHEVVDGKQRLTAILRFVGRHPLAVERVEKADAQLQQGGALLRAFYGDYPKFRSMWKSLFHEQLTTKLEDQYFFPFKLRNSDAGLGGPLAILQGKYYTQVLEHPIHAADETVTIRELFEGTPEYRIPVIVYKKARQSQIHEVFNLYNKQGMHLNAEEIRNAIYHELHLTRATLVAAGDSDPRIAAEEIAPSLSGVWADVGHLGKTLRGFGFGESRYRRTKLLSWVVATLLGDTFDHASGQWKDLPSTARHIDNLLADAKRSPSAPLNTPEVVGELFAWVAVVAKVHAAYDEELWSPKFKDGSSGQKWQELQLVGSLVGLAIAYMADEDGFEEQVGESADFIFAASDSADLGEEASVWARPKKTQTKTQWAFIARVTREILSLLEVDVDSASANIRKRFGSSGVESLMAVLSDETG